VVTIDHPILPIYIIDIFMVDKENGKKEKYFFHDDNYVISSQLYDSLTLMAEWNALSIS